MEIVVGGRRTARRAYGFDEVALVPGNLVIDARDVDVSWTLAGRRIEVPILASSLDAAVNPRLAIEMGRLGGLAVLNLDGIQTRYEDAEEVIESVARHPKDDRLIGYLQSLYSGQPVKPELIKKRVAEIKAAGGIVAVAAAPHSAKKAIDAAIEAGADIFVIQSTVGAVRFESREIAEGLRLECLPSRFSKLCGKPAPQFTQSPGCEGGLSSWSRTYTSNLRFKRRRFQSETRLRNPYRKGPRRR